MFPECSSRVPQRCPCYKGYLHSLQHTAVHTCHLSEQVPILFHVQICWLDIGNALKIRDIHEQIRVQEVGIVYITANADDVRIIFPNQSGFQNRNGFVRGFDGQVNVVMGGIEAFFHRFKCCNCFRFVLQQFHFNLSIAGLTRTASLQQQCGKRNACQNQTTNCISFFS